MVDTVGVAKRVASLSFLPQLLARPVAGARLLWGRVDRTESGRRLRAWPRGLVGNPVIISVVLEKQLLRQNPAGYRNGVT